MKLRLVVRAPPAQVWRVVGDGFGDFHAWSGGAVLASQLDAERPAVGVARTSRLRTPMLRQDVVVERITDWRPPHGYAYELVEPPPGFRRAGNRWSLAPHHDGTLLTIEPQAVTGSPWALLLLAISGLAARPLARRMVAAIERLASDPA
jgi:hypothetical protein